MKIVLKPDIYPLTVAIWLGPWEDTPVRRFARESRLWSGEGDFPTPPRHGANGCCYSFGPGSLIWMPRPPKTPAQIGTLAHEAMHAVAFTAQHLGFRLSDDSDEFYAYMMSYIVSSTLARLRK